MYIEARNSIISMRQGTIYDIHIVPSSITTREKSCIILNKSYIDIRGLNRECTERREDARV